ncbi:hypothetical protein ELE36_11800 [Pseudolysobacter antarcticus]|uniref:Uncharacterized protein n=1 Tax=Pseudolysobacter antarcticus TaxID=2511995 RepID=A0A411HQD7_9GAMM|nr:hypothetical protein ELE36_11800 [Pseudolysobacter antarcticus]
MQVEDILSVLDQCNRSFAFPMLDNGYVYLAASRLSLYRSSSDWAMVIEIFGFSPRAGIPDTQIYTFSSKPCGRKSKDNFVNAKAYEKYIAGNPHNESTFVFPVAEGNWQDPSDSDLLACDALTVAIRGKEIPVPKLAEYAQYGIALQQPPSVMAFEFCRALAKIAHQDVLATPEERRANVLPELEQIMQLDEWNHPNIVISENLPSTSETFRQLAQVLVSGDLTLYKPSDAPNTHWSNWRDGGTL